LIFALLIGDVVPDRPQSHGEPSCSEMRRS
jgi:hypothetical protein